MNNPCGTTAAHILEKTEANGMPVYFGTGVNPNPANSMAQFFVAWGQDVLRKGLVHTYNIESPTAGLIWFIDEDEAEAKYTTLVRSLSANNNQSHP